MDDSFSYLALGNYGLSSIQADPQGVLFEV